MAKRSKKIVYPTPMRPILMVMIGFTIAAILLLPPYITTKKENQKLKNYISHTKDINSTDLKQNVEITEDNKTYVNKFIGMSLEMPVGWSYDEYLYSAVNVLDNPNAGTGFLRIKAQENYNVLLSTLQQEPDLSNEQYQESVKIDGKDAIKITKNAGEGYVNIFYYIPLKNLTLRVIAFLPKEESSEFKDFTKMIESLKIADYASL